MPQATAMLFSIIGFLILLIASIIFIGDLLISCDKLMISNFRIVCVPNYYSYLSESTMPIVSSVLAFLGGLSLLIGITLYNNGDV